MREVLHRHKLHPDYEYETTETGRKTMESVTPEGEGWEPNPIIGGGIFPDGTPKPRRNWARFDWHEEEYWRRRKAV